MDIKNRVNINAISTTEGKEIKIMKYTHIRYYVNYCIIN